jgi:hypothetical protein
MYLKLVIFSVNSVLNDRTENLWCYEFEVIRASNSSLCEISSSHGGEYDVQSCLLGCTSL